MYVQSLGNVEIKNRLAEETKDDKIHHKQGLNVESNIDKEKKNSYYSNKDKKTKKRYITVDGYKSKNKQIEIEGLIDDADINCENVSGNLLNAKK